MNERRTSGGRAAADLMCAAAWARDVADRVLARYARERSRCGGGSDAMEHLRLALVAELEVEARLRSGSFRLRWEATTGQDAGASRAWKPIPTDGSGT
jgi:hypothetical protein